jgi:hypothetical protein
MEAPLLKDKGRRIKDEGKGIKYKGERMKDENDLVFVINANQRCEMGQFYKEIRRWERGKFGRGEEG